MGAAPINPDIRWKQRLNSFRKAFLQLAKAVRKHQEEDLSDLEKQGLVQAFEFTHELAWNTLKDYLELQGEQKIYGSREATRRAFKVGLIADGEIWMGMIDSRNRSSHSYHEDIADEIASLVSNSYFPAFQKFDADFLKLEIDS